MRIGFLFILFLCGVLGTNGDSRAAPKRHPVRAQLKAKSHKTKRHFIFSENKGYTYEVKEKLTDIAVVRVFNAEGKALDGFYEISIEELHELLGREISAGVEATANRPQRPACANCQLSEPAADRRPAAPRPVPSP